MHKNNVLISIKESMTNLTAWIFLVTDERSFMHLPRIYRIESDDCWHLIETLIRTKNCEHKLWPDEISISITDIIAELLMAKLLLQNDKRLL